MSWLDRFLGRKVTEDIATSTGKNTTPKTSGTIIRPLEPALGWILRPGQVLLRNYRIQTMVGSPGGMGQVFAAEDLALGLKVAIKVPALNILLSPNGAERFLREARVAARLGPHPHIVQIRACLTDPDLGVGIRGNEVPIPFIVMEYLGGGDLAAVLKNSPLDFHMVSRLFDHICSALQCAHSYVYEEEGKTVHGLVHRDLKPENVCFDDGGRLVIVDFGIAKLMGEFSSTLGMAGTPSHMAPEQWNPARGVDHRTDVYALGVILYQMVTGQLPFIGTLEQVAAAHLTEPPPDPRRLRPELPKQVAEAILVALEKEKANRFSGIDEFWQAVKLGFGVSQNDSNAVNQHRPAAAFAENLPKANGRMEVRRLSRPGTDVLVDIVIKDTKIEELPITADAATLTELDGRHFPLEAVVFLNTPNERINSGAFMVHARPGTKLTPRELVLARGTSITSLDVDFVSFCRQTAFCDGNLYAEMLFKVPDTGGIAISALRVLDFDPISVPGERFVPCVRPSKKLVFSNHSNQTIIVCLIGPTANMFMLLKGAIQIVHADAGNYCMELKYGDNAHPSTCFRGAPFDVVEEETAVVLPDPGEAGQKMTSIPPDEFGLMFFQRGRSATNEELLAKNEGHLLDACGSKPEGHDLQ
jgi:serine/threonine-protein kinase